MKSVAESQSKPGYRSLTQVVLETLRERIYDGEFEPGGRLNIADLAHSFSASPVPVREALRTLESEGLVEFRPNRGVVVRELSVDEVRELFLVRLPLEALAAVAAAKRGTAEDFDRLEALLHELNDVKNSADWHVLHERFHQQFYALSGYPRLSGYVDVLRGQMRPYSKLYLADPRHVKLAQEEHFEMLAAARSADIEGLKTLIRAHLTRPAHMALTAFGLSDFSNFDTQIIP